MVDKLLMCRGKLDSMETDPIFSMWLFGNVDEDNLSENQKTIIAARQLYYDLIVTDDDIKRALKRFHCEKVEDLRDPIVFEYAARFLGVGNGVLNTKIELLIKRREHSKKVRDEIILGLKKEN